MDFKKSFCCGFNLSNDDIISVLCKHTTLRFVTTSGSENGCGKRHFLVQDLENRATHPHQEFPGVPPGSIFWCFLVLILILKIQENSYQ